MVWVNLVEHSKFPQFSKPGEGILTSLSDTAIAHYRKRREEERVTPVVAVVTAESPACTINRAYCYMPTHMASLSKCEILIGSCFSVGRELNDVPSKP